MSTSFPTAMRNCRAYFLVAIPHTAKHVQLLLRQTVRFSQTKRGAVVWQRSPLRTLILILRGHLRRAAGWGNGRSGELDRPSWSLPFWYPIWRLCPGAGFRDSAALRSGASPRSWCSRDFPQLSPCTQSHADSGKRLLNGQPAIIIRVGQLDIGQAAANAADDRRGDRKTPASRMSQPCPMWKYGVIEPWTATADGYPSCCSRPPVTAEMLGITPKDTGLPLVVRVGTARWFRACSELLHLSSAGYRRAAAETRVSRLVEDVSPDDGRRPRQHVPAEKGRASA